MPAHKLTTDTERFLSKVDRTSTPDGCWPWTGSLFKHSGYGQMSSGSRAQGTFKNGGAHRFALELRIGRPLHPGMMALHTCDNPACVRTEGDGFYEVNGVQRRCFGHLFEGTTQENTADRHAKGKSASGTQNGAYLHPESLSRGEDRYSAKLTEENVLEIRESYKNGARQIDLAVEYGVWKTTIQKVVARTSWKHI